MELRIRQLTQLLDKAQIIQGGDSSGRVTSGTHRVAALQGRRRGRALPGRVDRGAPRRPAGHLARLAPGQGPDGPVHRRLGRLRRPPCHAHRRDRRHRRLTPGPTRARRCPRAGAVELAGGRGPTFVREVAGPPGAPVVVLLHGLTAVADLNWFPVFERPRRGPVPGAVGGAPGLRPGPGVAAAGAGWRTWPTTWSPWPTPWASTGSCPSGTRWAAPWPSWCGAATRPGWRGWCWRGTASVFSVSARERVLSRLLPAASIGARARRRWPAASSGAPSGPASPARRSRRGRSPSWPATDRPPCWRGPRPSAGSRPGAWIGEVDVPTAVVVTSRDVLVPTDRQLALAAAIPGAQVVARRRRPRRLHHRPARLHRRHPRGLPPGDRRLTARRVARA